jgi:flagellar motor switch protein FliM
MVALALPGAETTVLGATDLPAEAVALKAMALACGFEVMAGEASLGAIGFCVALQTLAGIENSLGGAIADDWATRLGEALGNARLNVRCVLARPTLSAGEVARLVPGAVIPIPNLNEVALIAGGYRIATGVADTREGRAVIKINRTEFN